MNACSDPSMVSKRGKHHPTRYRLKSICILKRLLLIINFSAPSPQKKKKEKEKMKQKETSMQKVLL